MAELVGPAESTRFALPRPLAQLQADPAPILDTAREVPFTLLHGDPWPGNVRRPGPGRQVWVDWEQASAGPAAADLATWLDQTPWHTGRSFDQAGHLDRYFAARRLPVDRERFLRALDAASVLWFFAYDLSRLEADADPDFARSIVSARAPAAERLLGS